MTFNAADEDLRVGEDYVKLGADSGLQWLAEASTSGCCAGGGIGGGGGGWWWWAKLVLVVLFVGVLGAVFLKWVGPFFMEKEIIPIIIWERKTFSTAMLALIVFVSLAIFPSILLPSTPSMWIAGMTFGYGYGFLLVIGAIPIGVSIPYFIGSLFYHRIHVWLERYPKKASVIRLAGEGNCFNQFRAVALIRISPFPYLVYNYCAVATDVKYCPYLLGTLVGMVPEIFVALYTGILIKTLANASHDGRSLSAPQIIFNVIGFWLTARCYILPSPTILQPHTHMALPFLLPFVFLPLVFLFHHLFYRLRFRLPPGPRPWPVVGNLYDVKPIRFRCYADWAERYGPIISVWFGSTLNVIVSKTELAKEVLKEKDQQLADRHRSRSAAKFSRDGQDLIWADYGPHYVKVRKVCTLELFSPKRLEALRPIREDEVTAMVESIYNDSTSPDNLGKSLQVKKYLGAVAFNNITRLAFGKRFVNSEGIIDEQGQEFKGITANGVKIGASLAMAEHIPWLRWMFPLDEEAFAKHAARRDRLTREIMEEHTLTRQKSGGAKQHFFDALLTLKDKYDLSEDTIIGLLWDMITAGMDTTAISAEWAMAELIKNPRVQQKAQEELDHVIGHERVITELDFARLPYLQCVAKEALRLHPPTPLMLPHRSNANVKIGGYDIPKGANIHVNVWAVARDPDVWKSPLEFRPERFLEEDIDMKGHDFRLLPFGAGRRVCPGAQLGINLVTSMIGHLLHHFNWAPPNGVSADEIDMGESPGMVTYMRTSLEALPTPRLPAYLYKRMAVDM